MKQPKEQTEKEFLSSYQQNKYDCPSVAADMVIFTIKTEKSSHYRKLPQKKLSILLVKRSGHPFKDCWALPGGFANKGETLEETAVRELQEETGVSDAALFQLQMFSDVNRDPRGWILSCAYMALAEEDRFEIKAGSDAAEAEWFQVKFHLIHSETQNTLDGKQLNEKYEMQLNHSDITLTASIAVKTNLSPKRLKTEYEIVESNGLAFDHAKIIAFAIDYLRKNLNSERLAFSLLPDTFTLTNLQQVYETVLEEELLTANFRRKISEYVIETAQKVEGAGHRPSKLYRQNLELLP